MKTLFSIAAALLLLASPAWAASKTVTLSVPGMFCATCPITVKKALTNVAGVTQVTVDLEKKQAAVTFDDAKTNAVALTKATTNAGYPSSVKEK
jgi:mercuric ion binding protein